MIRWAFSFFSRGRGARVIEEFEEPAKASSARSEPVAPRG
jgi:hypothetical protein